MELDERVEVGLAQRVAVQRQERAVETACREADAAAGAERLVLDAVLEREVAVRCPEVLLDLGRHVPARDDGAAHAVTAQVLEGVGEQRAVDQRQHVLADRLGQRSQARPLSAHEDHGGQAHPAPRPMPS